MLIQGAFYEENPCRVDIYSSSKDRFFVICQNKEEALQLMKKLSENSLIKIKFDAETKQITEDIELLEKPQVKKYVDIKIHVVENFHAKL